MALGETLKRIRVESQVARADVAERLFLSSSYIYLIENEERTAPPQFEDHFLKAVYELSKEKRSPTERGEKFDNTMVVKTRVSRECFQMIRSMAPGMSANHVARALLEVVLLQRATYPMINSEVGQGLSRMGHVLSLDDGEGDETDSRDGIGQKKGSECVEENNRPQAQIDHME